MAFLSFFNHRCMTYIHRGGGGEELYLLKHTRPIIPSVIYSFARALRYLFLLILCLSYFFLILKHKWKVPLAPILQRQLEGQDPQGSRRPWTRGGPRGDGARGVLLKPSERGLRWFIRWIMRIMGSDGTWDDLPVFHLGAMSTKEGVWPALTQINKSNSPVWWGQNTNTFPAPYSRTLRANHLDLTRPYLSNLLTLALYPAVQGRLVSCVGVAEDVPGPSFFLYSPTFVQFFFQLWLSFLF